MSKPRVMVLRAPGTNCDAETSFAFEQAGGQCEVFHVNRLLERQSVIDAFDILCIPGGFSFGDDIAAGRIFANQILHRLYDAVNKFREDGKLILGICNGFQVLLKSGLLTAAPQTRHDPASDTALTLTWNDSRKYEDRWVTLKCDHSRCVFLDGIDEMYLPIAHAEGKLVARQTNDLLDLASNGQLALRYCLPGSAEQSMQPAVGASSQQQLAGSPNASTSHSSVDQPSVGQSSVAQVSPADVVPYPLNPNGSMLNAAGLCDATGRVFGLMPHPERHIDPTQHPRWTREPGRTVGDGLAIFQNAIKHVKS